MNNSINKLPNGDFEVIKKRPMKRITTILKKVHRELQECGKAAAYAIHR